MNNRDIDIYYQFKEGKLKVQDKISPELLERIIEMDSSMLNELNEARKIRDNGIMDYYTLRLKAQRSINEEKLNEALKAERSINEEKLNEALKAERKAEKKQKEAEKKQKEAEIREQKLLQELDGLQKKSVGDIVSYVSPFEKDRGQANLMISEQMDKIKFYDKYLEIHGGEKKILTNEEAEAIKNQMWDDFLSKKMRSEKNKREESKSEKY